MGEILSQEKLSEDEKKKLLKPLYEVRNSLLQEYGFTLYNFEKIMPTLRLGTKSLIGCHIEQKIALSVWSKFESYFYRGGKKVLFRPWTKQFSMENKANGANITYAPETLTCFGEHFQVFRPDNTWEQECLDNHRVKYCRIIRIPGKRGWIYKLQLILKGEAPLKKNAQGEAIQKLGKGSVGIDIGTQTVAVVSKDKVLLRELASGANAPDKALRRINRAMDRSRRANNPEFFDEKGEIIPRNKLDPSLLDEKGKRKWHNSKNYERLAQKRRYLYAKCARIRKQQHEELATRVLSYGSEFHVEDMRFKALAKKAKKQDPKPGEKQKRRKRFGKSIANKAPAAFLNILQKKAEHHGGTFDKIDTVHARASQYNHVENTYIKPKLSERWKYLNHNNSRKKIQRDLYSAFLIMNINDELNGFNRTSCFETFDSFVVNHDREVQHLRKIHTPTSTGISFCAAQ